MTSRAIQSNECRSRSAQAAIYRDSIVWVVALALCPECEEIFSLVAAPRARLAVLCRRCRQALTAEMIEFGTNLLSTLGPTFAGST